MRDQSPPEGGANAPHKEIVLLQLENLRMKMRVEIHAEEKESTVRAERQRLQHGGGGTGLQQPGEGI